MLITKENIKAFADKSNVSDYKAEAARIPSELKAHFGPEKYFPFSSLCTCKYEGRLIHLEWSSM